MDDQPFEDSPEVGAATIVRPTKTPEKKKQHRQVPRWNVILWNDDDHSYGYVIRMLKELFGHPLEKGFRLAEKVDSEGRVIVLTTTKEHAELKQEQIHEYGPDEEIADCSGSMTATIEEAE